MSRLLEGLCQDYQAKRFYKDLLPSFHKIKKFNLSTRKQFTILEWELVLGKTIWKEVICGENINRLGTDINFYSV